MSIELKLQKMLWGRSGNCCAFPDCKAHLIQDIGGNILSVVGEIAHIVAAEPGGPRGDSDLPIEKRDDYSNLILLCATHHKIVDDHPTIYTVDKLIGYKNEHEKWAICNNKLDESKQLHDELYSEYLDTLLRLIPTDFYSKWLDDISSSNGPKMSKDIYENIVQINYYTHSRIWYRTYPNLEKAFLNVGNIANDIIYIFDHYSIDNGGLFYFTEKFYKQIGWNPELYNKLLSKYKYHALFLVDLSLEFTRALNYLFDNIRKYLFPFFRIHEGVLLIKFSAMTAHRVEYRPAEQAGNLYPGWKEFLAIRSTRDLCFGQGTKDIYTTNYELG